MLQCQHVSTVCFDRRTLRSWLVSTMFCQTRKMVSKLGEEAEEVPTALFRFIYLQEGGKNVTLVRKEDAPESLEDEAEEARFLFKHLAECFLLTTSTGILVWFYLCKPCVWNDSWLWHYHCCQQHSHEAQSPTHHATPLWTLFFWGGRRELGNANPHVWY